MTKQSRQRLIESQLLTTLLIQHRAQQNIASATEKKINAMGYALGFCKDDRIAKKGCKHRSTMPYNGEFKHPKFEDVMTRAQDVCTECGRISKWVKCNKDGSYTPKF